MLMYHLFLTQLVLGDVCDVSIVRTTSALTVQITATRITNALVLLNTTMIRKKILVNVSD
jgi:hypothetical protein